MAEQEFSRRVQLAYRDYGLLLPVSLLGLFIPPIGMLLPAIAVPFYVSYFRLLRDDASGVVSWNSPESQTDSLDSSLKLREKLDSLRNGGDRLILPIVISAVWWIAAIGVTTNLWKT